MNDPVRIRERNELRARVQHGLVQARSGLSQADYRVRRFARDQPLAAALIALSAGFVLGRALSRR